MISGNKQDLVQKVSDKLDCDLADLIKASFPQSIAQIIPMYAHTSSSSGADGDAGQEPQKIRKGQAMICLNYLSDAIGKEVCQFCPTK